MKQPTDLGMNRTGMAMAPIQAPKMMENVKADKGVPVNPVAGMQEVSRLRNAYAENAPPIGSVPPPATVKGVASAAMDMLKGKKPTVLLDKLGERLAFERTGTRIYDALLSKLQVVRAPETEKSLAKLEKNRVQEVAHFDLVWKSIESLGADPTTVTPAADVAGVQAMGLLQVLTDPRTSAMQCLHSLLVAELADSEGWTMLSEMADQIGNKEMAASFRRAMDEETEHLTLVRTMLREMAKKELS